MRTSQQTRQRPTRTQRINPRSIAAGLILQMPSEELQLRVEEEIAANPALEVAYDETCPDCGRGLTRGVCWSCRSLRQDAPPETPFDAFSLPWPRARTEREERTYDPVEQACAPLTLQEYVLQQARLVLGPKDYSIAEYLVAGLNEDGLLEADPGEAADALRVEVSEVHAVLAGLQTLDPPGVCARTVQDSVLAQLHELAQETPVPPQLERMVVSHWNDLAHHSYEKIARRLGASPAEIEAVVAFMRTHLCPYPGRLFHPPHATQEDDRTRFLRPDVIIRRELAAYVVEIVHSYDFELRVSEAYQRVCATAHGNGNGRSKEPSAEHAQAVDHYRRAVWLLRSLQFREDTLRRIAEYAAHYQRPFLDTGQEHKMKLLTRTQVAAHIGKQVSTVSRAIANKFVLLPNGDLVPLAKLFSPAVAPKTIVAELLSNESPDDPLTDEKIARILRLRGINIARRTVAKYRLALRLPSSVQRGRR